MKARNGHFHSLLEPRMAIWYTVIGGAFANQAIACVFKRLAARNAPEPPLVILVVVVRLTTNGEPAPPW
jgi:hypothetical protein